MHVCVYLYNILYIYIMWASRLYIVVHKRCTTVAIIQSCTQYVLEFYNRWVPTRKCLYACTTLNFELIEKFTDFTMKLCGFCKHIITVVFTSNSFIFNYLVNGGVWRGTIIQRVKFDYATHLSKLKIRLSRMMV